MRGRVRLTELPDGVKAALLLHCDLQSLGTTERLCREWSRTIVDALRTKGCPYRSIAMRHFPGLVKMGDAIAMQARVA